MKRLLVLVFSHPCRGLPGRGCHCVAPRESVVVALGRSTVGIVVHGVPEGLDLDGDDDALADKQDVLEYYNLNLVYSGDEHQNKYTGM